MVPDRIVNPKPHKPAEQEIGLEPLHELTLRAKGIERLEEHSPQQLLGRDGGPPQLCIQGGELSLQISKRLIHDGSDEPERVIGSDPRLEIHVRKE